jgi:hypothetical protein
VRVRSVVSPCCQFRPIGSMTIQTVPNGLSGRVVFEKTLRNSLLA